MDNDKSELRWGVEQRLEFIEFRLFWEGHVNRSDLMGQFGVSVNQASTDLNRYIGYPATIYYAFKQSEVAAEGISSTGWATFLQAVVEAGYAVVGTWPMRTEMANRMVASGTNALANSVVLVCRKKDATADTITRAEFIRALKRELPPAIAELQARTSPRPTCRNRPSAPAWASSRATAPCSRPTTAR